MWWDEGTFQAFLLIVKSSCFLQVLCQIHRTKNETNSEIFTSERQGCFFSQGKRETFPCSILLPQHLQAILGFWLEKKSPLLDAEDTMLTLVCQMRKHFLCVCVGMCLYICWSACMWKSEDNLRYCSSGDVHHFLRSLFDLELANQTRRAGQCALGMSVSPVLGSTMLGFNISLGESNSSPLASILLTISTSYPCNPVRKHFLVNISMSQPQPEHRIRWRTVISWILWPQVYRVFTWIDICIDRTCISMTDIQEKDPWLCDEKTSECNLARFGVTRISHVTKV